MPLSKPQLTYFQDRAGMVRFHFRGKNAEVMVPSQPYGTLEHAEEGWQSITEALGIPTDSTPSYDVAYDSSLDAKINAEYEDVLGDGTQPPQGGVPLSYADPLPDLKQTHPAAGVNPDAIEPGREDEAAVAADPHTAGEPIPGEPEKVRGEGDLPGAPPAR